MNYAIEAKKESIQHWIVKLWMLFLVIVNACFDSSFTFVGYTMAKGEK